MNGTADLHIHSSASDGKYSVGELLAMLENAGIHTFSITDHDTADGALEMQKLVPEGMRFIPGIEFSCVNALGKYHILGYGCDPENANFKEALAEGRRLRQGKFERRVAQLNELFGIELTDGEFEWLRSQKSPGKPHLGQVLVKRGAAPSVDAAIKQYVNKCKGGGRDRIEADRAIKAILSAGGVPVWAHPLGGEGEKRIEQYDFFKRLDELVSHGLMGLECHYSRYSQDDVCFLCDTAEARGLLISGGSDFHGPNKPDIRLGMLNCDGAYVETDALTLLDCAAL